MNTTTKKANWINKVKTVQQVNRQLVLRKLGISEEDYWDMMLDAGTRYLKNVLQVDGCIDDIMGAELYWKWWLNHWQKWDATWLREQKHEEPWLRAKLYDQLHDASEYGFAPNKHIMSELFQRSVLNKMIEEAEDETA